MRALTPLLYVWLSTACAAAPPAPKTPEAPPPLEDATTEPAKLPAPAASTRAPEPIALPPPPASCQAYVARDAAHCPSADTQGALAAALGQADAPLRDGLLACLEHDTRFAPGLMRALRAEFGPEECADALAESALATPGLSPEYESALFGLSVAAALARLASQPPKLEPPLTREHFQQYFEQDLKPWVATQARAIEELSRRATRLTGYGKAVAALAAGAADLRFVERVREAPIPEEMSRDPDVRNVYYAALDEALEPRKQRGRDAALVGLRLMSQLGVIHDVRVERARSLLAKLYSGSRVDALDRLLLPALPAAHPAQPGERLAALLPSFYADALLGEVDAKNPELLRDLLERGLPPSLRKQLDAADLPAELRKLYARGVAEVGRVYFRAADFKRVTELFGPKPGDDESALLSGVASALSAGPADIAEILFKGPLFSSFGSPKALEALAHGRGRYAGQAAFDAAYLLELAPRRDDPKFWEDLAQRYQAAASLLRDPRERAMAAEYQKAASATARSLGRGP